VRGARDGMPVSLMSGGNLQKAILARELTEEHEVLVAAAPTRGLDLAAAEAVRGHLRRERDGGCGLLIFSEDLAEVLQISDVVVVMYQGRIVGRFDRADVDVELLGLLMTGATSEPEMSVPSRSSAEAVA
jgi:simple sugar transport system ATP-binding protein